MLDTEIGHHVTVTSFVSAAEHGCYLCIRYWEYLRDSRQTLLEELRSLERPNSDDNLEPYYVTICKIWEALPCSLYSHQTE